MKNIRYLLLIMLICLLCGSVSASENGTDIVASTDVNQTLSVDVSDNQVNDTKLVESSSNEDVLGSGTYGDIENRIFNENLSEITLQKDTYYFGSGSGAPGIFINHPIVFDGNGSNFIVHDQIFLIRADNVVLRNINFEGYNEITTTGNIIQWSGSNAVIENCTFKNIWPSSPTGGALNWRGQNLSVINCKFDNVGLPNSARSMNNWVRSKMEIGTYGGAISISAINNLPTGKIEILDCEFDSCVAGRAAGAIWMGFEANTIVINNTDFRNCIAGECAVMHVAVTDSPQSSISITNSNFIRNIDYSHGTVGVGDAIVDVSSYNTFIENCKFEKNQDYSGGGLLFLGTDDSSFKTANLTILNCNFKDNNNEVNSKDQKGTLYFYGNGGLNFTLLSGPLVHSSNGNDHNRVSQKKQPTIINCVFERNYQSLDEENGRSENFMVSAYQLINSTFINNVAHGGAVLEPFVGVYNSTFSNNEALLSIISDLYGKDNLGYEIHNATFDHNEVHNEGTVYNPKLVVNCSFLLNNADYHGGAIFLGHIFGDGTHSIGKEEFDLIIIDSNFSSNRALNGSGGAIFSDFSKKVNISNCSFTHNMALYDLNVDMIRGCGGGVYALNADVNNCTFIDNFAENGQGGAIYSNYLNVNDTYFWNNHVQGVNLHKTGSHSFENGLGGAIFTFNNANVNNSVFYENLCDNGGAAICSGLSANIYNSNFTCNQGPNVLRVRYPSNIVNSVFLLSNMYSYDNIIPSTLNKTRHIFTENSHDKVANIVNNTFDVWTGNITCNQTENFTNWVLVSGLFNAGMNLEIPDLYLENITNIENKTGILLPVFVNYNMEIGDLKTNVYNLTGLIPGKYVVHHYYKDARGNVYLPINNNTNASFYISKNVITINGTYNTTNATVNFVFEPHEYNNTNWTVYNSTGGVVKNGTNSSFIKYKKGYVLNFTDLDAGNYTIYFFVPKEDGFYNVTANFTVFKADSNIKINKVSDGVFNTTDVMVNLTVVNQTNVSFTINSTTNSSLYNVTLIVKKDGNVTFNIEKANVTYPDINITAALKQINQTKNYILNISGLNADKYNIIFTNHESINYNPSAAEKTFVVFKASSLINITNVTNGVFNTTSVAVNLSVINQTNLSFVIRNATGNYTVNVIVDGGDVVLYIVNKTREFENIKVSVNLTSHKNLNYTYIFSINGLNAGDYTISLLNNQSINYKESKLNRKFKVNKASSLVNITNVVNSTFNTTDIAVAFNIINQTNVSFIVNDGKSKFTVYINDVVNLTIVKKNNEFSNMSVKSSFTSNALNYNYTVIISGLNAGNYTIVVNNDENRNYNASCDKSNFTVFKANSTVVIDNDPVNGTFNVSNVEVSFTIVNETSISYYIINNDTKDNFTVIYKNGKFEVVNYTATLKVNDFKFNLTKINEKYVFKIFGIYGGVYNITIFNNENDNYNQSNATAIFKVFKTTSLVNITNVTNAIYNTTDVIVKVSIINQTNVSFVVSNATSNFTVIVNDGVVNVNKKSGEFVNVTVKGNLINHIGNNYNYTFVIKGLISDNYTIDVYNNVSQNYLSSKDNVSFEVIKANSTVNITTVDGIYNTTDVVVKFIIVNQTDLSKVYFVISNATGDEFIVSLNEIKNGLVKTTLTNSFDNVNVTGSVIRTDLIYNYTFVISGLIAGKYNVTVFNNETRNYNHSKDNNTFLVYKAPSSVNVTAVDGIYNNTNVVVNVTVVNQTDLSKVYFVVVNSTGGKFNVTLVKIDNGIVVNTISKLSGQFVNVDVNVTVVNKGLNYTYNVVISGLVAGSYNITVFNGETKNYTACDNYTLFNVSKANSTVNVTAVDGVYNDTDVTVNVTLVNRTVLSFIISNGTRNFTVNVSNDGVVTILRNATEFTNVNVIIKKSNIVGLNCNYTFTISGLDAGNYNIIVYNNESSNYSSALDNASFMVYRASSNVAIVNITDGVYNTTCVVFNASVVNQTNVSFVISNGTHNFTVYVEGSMVKIVRNGGFVNVNVDFDIVYKSGIDYNYTFVISGLDAGNYNITILNNQSDNYNASMDNASFVVYKANSSVIIDNIVNGTFNVTSVNVTYSIINETVVSYIIRNIVTGDNFTVVINDNEFEVVNASSGLNVVNYRFNLTKVADKYVFSIIGVEGGNYKITIINNKSDNYNASNDTSTFTILTSSSLVNITSIVDGIYNTTCVVVNVSVVNQTNVSFVVSNGTHNFTVNVTGNSINIYRNDGEFRKVNVTFKASDITGLDCDYTFVISGLDTGYYNITVLNNKSVNFENSMDNASFEVIKSNSSVNITTVDGIYNTTDVIVNFTVVNQTDLSKVYFIITNSTGDEFIVNLKEINEGIVKTNDVESLHITGRVVNNGLTYYYTFIINGLLVGKYNITVFNNETKNYNASKNNNTFIVYKASSRINITAVDGIYNTSDVIVNMTVVNKTSVSFVIGNGSDNITVNVVNGEFNVDYGEFTGVRVIKQSIVIDGLNYTYNFIISGLNAGNYNITGFNDESSNYNSSEFNKLFHVIKASTDVNITGVSDAVYNTTTVVVNVIVVNKTSVSFVIGNGSANFTVSVVEDKLILDKGKFSNVSVVKVNVDADGLNYTYEFIISGLDAGNYNILAFNAESDNYNMSNDDKNFTVFKANSTVLIDNVSNAFYNNTDIRFDAHIINQTSISFVVSNGTSNFTVNVDLNNNEFIYAAGSIVIAGKLNSNSSSDYNYSFIISGLNAGNYNITIHNNESLNYNPSSFRSNFTVYKSNSSIMITEVEDGIYNSSAANITYHILNETDVTYYIINDNTKANFTVVNNNGVFEVVNYTQGLNIGQFKFNLTKSGEEYSFSIVGVDAGNYTIVIINHENNNYNSVNMSAEFNVQRSPSKVNILDVDDAIFNTTDVVINVLIINQTSVSFVVGNASGNFTVNITLNGDTPEINYVDKTNEFLDVGVTVSLNNHNAVDYNYTIVINNLEHGIYNVTFNNDYGINYLNSSNSSSFNVYKASSSVDVNAVNGIYDTADVVVNFTVVNQTDLSKVYFIISNASGEKFNVTLNSITGDGVRLTIKKAQNQFENVQIKANVIKTGLTYDYSVKIAGLSAGNYNVTVFNDETGNYNASRNNTSFVVYKASSSVNITGISNALYNTTHVVVNLTVINQTRVSFMIGNIAANFTVNMTVENNKPIFSFNNEGRFGNVTFEGIVKNTGLKYDYSILISNLNVNRYHIIFYNHENLNYNSSSDEGQLNVGNVGSAVDISAVNGIFDSRNVTVNINVVNQTSLSFTISNETDDIIVNVSIVDNKPVFKIVNGDNSNIDFDGQVTNRGIDYNYIVHIKGLNAGKYNITAFNSESDNYFASEDNASFIVYKASSKVIINTTNGIYDTVGAEINLTVLNETGLSFEIINKDNRSCKGIIGLNGNVDVFTDDIGGVSFNPKFVNGKYILIVSGLDVGNYTVNVYNAESDNYNASDDGNTFEIVKANSVINITRIVDGIYNTSNVEVSLNVVNKTTVSYTLKFRNGTSISENITQSNLDFILSGLNAGNYTLIVYNWDDMHYNGFKDESNFTVGKASSEVNIIDITNGIYDTENITVTFNVINKTDVYFVVNNGTFEFKVNLDIVNGSIVPVDGVVVACTQVANGYKIEISGLNSGNYEITIDNNESSNYNASSDVGKFIVSKASSAIDVESTDGIYNTTNVVVNFTIVNQTDLSKVYFVLTDSNGEQINISLISIIDNNVHVDIKGSDINVRGHADNNGLTFNYSFVISNLPANDYSVEVFNGETANYNASSNNTSSFTIYKASSSINVDVIDGIYDTVDVIIELDVVNETAVSLDIMNDKGAHSKIIVNHNDNEVKSSIDGVGSIVSSNYIDGKYRLVISGLGTGNYKINVYNAESDKYNSSKGEDTFVVNKASSKINIINITDGIYNTSDVKVIITAINKTNVIYAVNYLNGTAVYNNVNVSNNEFIISNLDAGDYKIIVHNNENENYTSSKAVADFHVNRASSSTNITNVVGGIYDTLSVALTIKITNETSIGYVIKNSKGEIVENYDVARNDNSVFISGLRPDNYTVEVINKQNKNYNSSSAVQSFTVIKATSEVVISPIVNVTFNDKNVVVDYTIYNRTSYEVHVINKLTNQEIIPLSVNETSVIFNLIAAGNYTIKITNHDSELYTSSYDSRDFEVYKAGSYVNINPIENTEYSTKEVSVDYGVSNRTGDVEVYIYKDGAKIFSIVNQVPDSFNVIPNKEITYTKMFIGVLSPGNYSINVFNPGNENFTESNDTSYFSIAKATSEVNLTVSDNGVFTVNLTDGAKGRVTLKFNDTRIEELVLTNSSKITAISLPSGNYTVIPYYDGNDNYRNSTGKPVTFMIDNTKQIDMNVSVINPTYPNNGTIIITSDVDGDYIVEVNNKSYHVAVENGYGNITIDQLPLGIYDVSVTSNVPNYVVNHKSTRLMVHNGKVKGDAITIDAQDLIRGYNSPYDFKATFYDIYGDVLKNTEVEFIINGTAYKVMTDNVGVALITLRLAVGEYKVFSRNIITDEVTVNNLTIVKRLIGNKNIVTDYNSGYNYKILVIDDDGTPVSEGVKFTIPLNGKLYSYVTDSKGYINIKIDERFVSSVSKNKLVYTFTLSYKGYSIKNTVAINQILKTTKKVKVKTSAKKLVLKATLKTSKGKALKNKKITFKFKGKTYKAKTNKKGIAKVTIKKNVIKKLKVGRSYAVKISYLKNTIKSFVKVKK